MENLSPQMEPATFESIRAILKETAQLQKELMRETEQHRKENEKKAEQSRIEADKRMKKLEELMGSWAKNYGSFAEEYFFNSFENKRQNFFGEKFDEIRKNLKGKSKKLDDEYDIVLYNGTSVAIIEVKSKAHENDIPTVLKKAETFRFFFPDYEDYKIYLGLASMSFYPELEQECINQGIAVVKQVGDTVVINDAHLRVF